MEVTIDENWHYVAKDLNGIVHIYSHKPFIGDSNKE